MYYRGFDFEALGIILIIGLLIGLTVVIFFLLTLQRALEAVSPDLRKMQPGMVWLNLIPIFGLAWMFVTVIGISDSIRDEYRRRGLPLDSDRPTFGIGIAYAVLSVCGWVPGLNYITPIGGLVCFIIYWVNVNTYKDNLNNPSMAGNMNYNQFGQQQFGQQQQFGGQQQQWGQQGFNQQQGYNQGYQQGYDPNQSYNQQWGQQYGNPQQGWNNPQSGQQQWGQGQQWQNPQQNPQQQWQDPNQQWQNPQQQQWPQNPPQNPPTQNNDDTRWAPPSNDPGQDPNQPPPYNNDNYQK